jgi:hypothetical protein
MRPAFRDPSALPVAVVVAVRSHAHWHFKLPPTGTSASAEAKRRKVACRTLLEICTRVCAALPAVLALLLTIIAASSAAARSCNDVDHVVRRHCAYRVVLRVRCNERC